MRSLKINLLYFNKNNLIKKLKQICGKMKQKKEMDLKNIMIKRSKVISQCNLNILYNLFRFSFDFGLRFNSFIIEEVHLTILFIRSI